MELVDNSISRRDGYRFERVVVKVLNAGELRDLCVETLSAQ
jgi:hypothetical protein